jgi:biofilm PGA synthesis N-glycosyltransferase PgaC
VRLVVVVPFLNEEEHLPALLASIEQQTRPPDELLLVDDGSTDRSPEIAADYAMARVLRRPVRPRERDRMATASELDAFTWGLAGAGDWELAAKVDADIELTPECFAEIERQFEADPKLGMAGPYLSVVVEGVRGRQRCPPDHVEGGLSFYRRECFEQVFPLPQIIGWDTIDEVRARIRGWRTKSFEISSGDPLLRRPTGSYDGMLRGFRRTGLAAYAYGAHPLHVLAAAASRAGEKPRPLCGVNYLLGWAGAALGRYPRAEPEVRRAVRRENLERLRGTVRR